MQGLGISWYLIIFNSKCGISILEVYMQDMYVVCDIPCSYITFFTFGIQYSTQIECDIPTLFTLPLVVCQEYVHID